MESKKKSRDNRKMTENIPEKIRLQLNTLYVKMEEILKKHIALGEKEQLAIAEGDEKKLHAYKELEKAFIKEEKAYGQVILTFAQLYAETGKDDDRELNNLKSKIDTLQKSLVLLINKNKEALEKEMISVQSELTLLSQKERKKKSPYTRIGNPTYVDIQV